MNTRRIMPFAMLALLAACDGAAGPAAAPTSAAGSAAALRFGDLAIAINAVDQQPASTGGTAMAVSYTLSNAGAAPIVTLEQPTLTLVDAAGRSFAPQATAAIAAGQDFFGNLDEQLAPGASTQLRSMWNLPVDAVDRQDWRLVLRGYEDRPIALP